MPEGHSSKGEKTKKKRGIKSVKNRGDRKKLPLNSKEKVWWRGGGGIK